jgi:HK97 family phage portal protein
MALATRLMRAGPGHSASAVVRSLPPGLSGGGMGGSSSTVMIPMGGSRAGTGLVVSQATAMQVSTVYACVAIRAEDVARCTPSLVREDKPWEAVKDHAVAEIFRRPNRVQTWFEFAEQLEAALLLRTNAYAVCLRDSRGNPLELIPVNPDWVQVLESPGGHLFYSVGRAGLWLQAVLGGMPQAIPAEDVLHLRGLSFNTVLGAARLAFARETFGLALAQERQAAKWSANASRPSGVLTTEGTLTDEQAKRAKAEWQALNSGIENTGSTAVLEGGLKWAQMQMTSVDAEFMASRTFTVEEICRFFRMPPHKVGHMGGATKGNIAAQDQDYVNNTVMPDLERIEQKLVRFFGLDREGLAVNLDEEKLLRADIKTRTESNRAAIMSMQLTPDEARAKERREPKGGKADELQFPLNLAARGSHAEGVAPDDAGRPPDGELAPGG